MVGTTMDATLAANVCPCVSLSIPLSVADLGITSSSRQEVKCDRDLCVFETSCTIEKNLWTD